MKFACMFLSISRKKVENELPLKKIYTYEIYHFAYRFRDWLFVSCWHLLIMFCTATADRTSHSLKIKRVCLCIPLFLPVSSVPLRKLTPKQKTNAFMFDEWK